MWLIVKYYIENDVKDEATNDKSVITQNVAHYKKKMLNVLTNVLKSVSSDKNTSNLEFKDENDF